MQTVSKKNVQLTIEELEKQNESFIAPDNIDRTNLGRDKANIKLYGTTIVNLLGKYGNFETDSNEDGLADGWNVASADSASLSTDKVFGSKAQYFEYTHNTGDATVKKTNLYMVDFPLISEHKYFISFFVKKGAGHTGGTTKLMVTQFDDADTNLGTYEQTITDDLDTNYRRFNYTFTTFTGTTKCILYLLRAYTSADGEKVELYADGAMLVDLTATGDLDPARAAYYTAKYGYSVTKWEELEDDDLVNELPYVDGVATIGWDWSSGDKTITIENRGKNLLDGALESGDIDSNGANIVDATKIRSANYISVKPDTIYILSNDKGYTDITAYYYTIDKIFLSSASVDTASFTTPTGTGYLRFVIVGTDTNAKVQLEEGDTATDYEPPRTDKIEIPAGTYLFGYAGVHEDMELQTGVKNAKWDFESSVAISSGSGTLTKSGTGIALLIDENGVPYEGTVSDITLTTSAPDGTYTVWYQLATPKTLKVPVTSNFNYLGRGHNQMLLSQHKKDTFIADGVTKTFNLSSTASNTGYTVKIAGQTISGVTKTTSSITFSVPPRRNEIIEVVYNVDYSLSPGIEAEVLKTNGTTMDVKFLTDISITEQEEALDVNPKNGPRKHAVRNRGYELSISKDLIEAQNNLEYFRDKTFRVKIYNSRDGTTEYLSPCTYKQGLSKDWISGSESVVILAGDYYDNA